MTQHEAPQNSGLEEVVKSNPYHEVLRDDERPCYGYPVPAGPLTAFTQRALERRVHQRRSLRPISSRYGHSFLPAQILDEEHH